MVTYSLRKRLLVYEKIDIDYSNAADGGSASGQSKGLVMNEKEFHAEGALGYIYKGAFLKVSAGYVPVRGLYVGAGVGIRRIDFARMNLRDIN